MMPHQRIRRVVRTLLMAAVAAGCESPTAISARVLFAAEPVENQLPAGMVPFRIVVANRSRDTIWLNACGESAIPDVTLIAPDGSVSDGTFGGCLAINMSGPISVAPGATYSSLHAAPRIGGTRISVSLMAYQDREMRRGVRLPAVSFQGTR